MGYAVYDVGNRKGGYGVPCYCEHPECNEEIDRGMSFACGDAPFSEVGCDRYFCEKHRSYTGFKMDGSMYPDYICDHEDGEKCDCFFASVCEKCATGQAEFPYKPEHPGWVYHLLHHESWSEWRKNNPEEVEKLSKLPAKPCEDEEYD